MKPLCPGSSRTPVRVTVITGGREVGVCRHCGRYEFLRMDNTIKWHAAVERLGR